jgi:hypothetical protein
MKLKVPISILMTASSNLKKILALHCAVNDISFRCGELSPKISIVDRQKDGYVIAVKKRCCLTCIRHFLKSENLSVSEDEKYLIISSK